VTVYLARWILPVTAPPLEGGAVAVCDGRIVAVGKARDVRSRCAGAVHDLGDVLLLPGLVNAHTHLELSALEGRLPRGGGFVEWVRELLALRMAVADEEVEGRARREAERLYRTGTVLVGDVSNTGASYAPLRDAGLYARLFHEAIGFQSGRAEEVAALCVNGVARFPDTERIAGAVAAHAPYSVSPDLFRRIGRLAERWGGVTAVHLAESPEEMAFIRTGGGPFRDLLEELGVWDGAWTPDIRGPVRYLDSLEFLTPSTLCVHLTQASGDDIALLRERGAWACVCPRSNARLGVGTPPVANLVQAGCRVAIGTDSLASNEDLNVLREMRYLHGLGLGVREQEILEMGTINGARALGFGSRLGSIEPGKVAALVTVPCPAGTITDPCGYLLEEADVEAVRPL